MKLVDTNLLVYAGTTCPQQGATRDWLDQELGTAGRRIGMPWESVVGYVRVASHPSVYDPPGELGALWAQVDEWLAAPGAWVPVPTTGHLETLRSLQPAVRSHRDVHDAHLAALAIGHGLTLCSADRGFQRFPGLHWENPLAG